jgi:hypothetical protein
VDARDAGVASASVNAMQQVGGSVGTSLFNTIAGTVLASYVTAHAIPHSLPAQQAKLAALGVQAHAAVHSYTVSFWIAAAVFLGGAVLAAIILRSGVPQTDGEHAAVAL